jgi:uncharacterized membrane protein YedE/YeeE
MTAARGLASFVLGGLFGVGLILSGMIQPQKIQDFLDIAGAWDPSLLLVMGGALLVTVLSFPLILRRSRPVLKGTFQMPVAKDVDAALLLGAGLFGVGWGLSGFCPGPALVGLTTGSRAAMIFVGSMLLGMLLCRLSRLTVKSPPGLKKVPLA